MKLKKISIFNIIILTILSIILSFIVTFQVFGISNDYNEYERIFMGNRSIEPFWYLIRLSNKVLFQGEITVLFFITTLIALINKFKFYEKILSKNTLLFMFMMISYSITCFWMHEYTQFRVAFVISFFPKLFSYLENREPGKYFLLCMFFISIHYSCIILFPLYFYVRMKKYYEYLFFPFLFLIIALLISKFMYGFDIISVLLDFLGIEYIKNIYLMKRGPALEDTYVLNPYYLGILFSLTIAYFIYKKKCFNVSKNEIFSFKLVSYALTLFYVMMCSPYSTMGFRFAELFLMFYLVVLITPIKYIKEKFFYLCYMMPFLLIFTIRMLRSTNRFGLS